MPAPHTKDENHRLARLRELLVLDSPPEPLFDSLARMASQVCGTPIALLSLVDEERQWFKANVGLPGVNQTARDIAFCARAIDGTDLFEVPDATQDQRFADNPLVTGDPHIRFYAGMPLTVDDGAPIGTLCVIDRQPRQLDAVQVRALEDLARLAAQALVMRRDLIQRSLQVRDAHEQAIAASEARYRSLVEQQQDLISLARPNGRLQYVNPAYARKFGLQPDELVGKNLFALVDPADQAAVRARFERLMSGEDGPGVDGVNRNIGRDGQVRWIAWTNSVQHDAQGLPLIHSAGRDITEQRLAEMALRDSRNLLERTGRVAGVGGWQYDLRTGVVDWTQQTRAIHEVDADFVPTLSAAIGFYAPQARPLIQEAVNLAVVTGAGWDLELQIITAKGRPLWARAVGEAEFEDGKAVRLVGAFQDITERKRMEARLAEAADQLHDLYDKAPCGYYSLDPEGRFIQANELTLSWLGASGDEVLGKLTPMDFFTEAGRSLFRLMFPSFKAEGSLGPIEFELCGRDGSQRWVSVTATAIYDTRGQFVKSRSVMYDVTEVHAARAELRRLSIDQNAMLDNEVVGIVKLRAGIAVWKNRALERMFGYEPDELLNQPSRLLFKDDASYDEEGRAAAHALATTGHHRSQLQMRRKDGSLIWVDTSGILLSPETGEAMWVLADITQLKEYQLQVEHIAFHDALTGLPNRLLLADRLQQAIALAGRLDQLSAVCYLDLDGFKAVNDSFGHDAGDALLAQVARRIAACVRGSDTVARLGGDEFVVLLTPMETEAECTAVLTRIAAAVGTPVPLSNASPPASAQVSASIGVAIFPRHGTLTNQLLARADAALYESKRAGKNRITIAD